MKKVLIAYGGSGDGKIKKEDYRKNYELLYGMGAEKGIKFYRGNINNYQGGKFETAQSFENNLWLQKTNIKPDIVIDKYVYSATEKENTIKKEISKKSIIINSLYFNKIFNSKFITYSIFSDYMPLTFIAYNKKSLISKIDKIKSKKVVIKPDSGFGGKGVFIADKDKAKKITTARIEFPVIVQEFIDSSKGIKGIVNNTHDLRVIFINHHPVMSYIREPVKNSLISNVSLGGKRRFLDLSLVPEKIKDEFNNIVNRMKIFENTIYSVDFVVDKNKKPYILEINSPPSFHLEDKKKLMIFYENIIKFLIKVKL